MNTKELSHIALSTSLNFQHTPNQSRLIAVSPLKIEIKQGLHLQQIK